MEGTTVGGLLWGLVRKGGQVKIGLEVVGRGSSGIRVLHTNDDAAGILKAPLVLRDHPVHEWHIDGDKIVIDIGHCRHEGIWYVGASHMNFCGVNSTVEVRDGVVRRAYKPCDFDNCPMADRGRRRVKE